MVEKNLVWIATKGGRERDWWRRVCRTGVVHDTFLEWNRNTCVRNWWDMYVGRELSFTPEIPEHV